MISSRGFDVSVMPHYSPLNPSLAAFNPSQIASGAMDVASLVKAIEKIKSDRALQEELNALKQKRMGATVAGYDTEIAKAEAFNPILYKQAAAAGATADATVKTSAPLADALVAEAIERQAVAPNRGAVTIAQADEDLSNIKPIGEAKRAQAGMMTRQGAIDLATFGPRKETAVKAAEGDAQRADMSEGLKNAQLSIARQAATFAQIGAPAEFQLRMNEINDRLKNATTDAELSREIKRADAKLKYAQADYARGLGRQTGRGVAPEQEIKAIIDDMTKLDKLGLENGQTFQAYRLNFFNEDGTVKNSSFWPGGNTEADITPDAKLFLAERKRMQNRLTDLTEKLEKGVKTPKSLPKSSAGGEKKSVFVQDANGNWVKK